jgi:DNA-binding NtrC family response regulator
MTKKPDCMFLAQGDGEFDSALSARATGVIIEHAMHLNENNITKLASDLGITRQRLYRICRSLGIMNEVRELMSRGL